MMGLLEYRRLAAHLAALTSRTATLTFQEIEGLVGGSLPLDAYESTQWWTNKGRGPARPWLNVGWRVETVDVLGRVITFARNGA